MSDNSAQQKDEIFLLESILSDKMKIISSSPNYKILMEIVSDIDDSILKFHLTVTLNEEYPEKQPTFELKEINNYLDPSKIEELKSNLSSLCQEYINMPMLYQMYEYILNFANEEEEKIIKEKNNKEKLQQQAKAEEKEKEKKELQILLTESVDQFIIENEEEDTENNRSSCKEKSLIVCENDKFSLLKNDTKKDNKNIKYDFEFVVANNDILFISKVKKQQCNKMTEITEELNGIEPNNHYELILQGKIKSTNNNNIINEKDQNEKSSIGKNDNIANKNRNINYNINNEIEKGNCLEINTIELKRTNIGSFNVVRTDNNNSVLTEKAKNNLIKIILPIRIKTTLKDFIHRSIFPLLINNLKKIAYYSKNVGVKVNDNNDNNDNKDKNAHHDDNDIHQEGIKKIKHKMSKFYSGKIEENAKDTSNNKSVMENNKK